MSLADEIRAYAYEHFVAPQLAAKGFAVVRASEVHKAMDFKDRYPAVCSVLGGKIFRNIYGIALVDRQGKKVSSATEYTYEPAADGPDTALLPAHLEALKWFEANAGKTVPWRELNDRELQLAIIPKGIYRPKDWKYALSIKIVSSGGYADEEPALQDGRVRFRYHQEERKVGGDPSSYKTNLGLKNCLLDGVPVGVVRQVQVDPSPLYEVLGLGQVVDWQDKFFAIELEAGGVLGADVSDLGDGDDEAAPTEPVSLEDARRRIQRAIVSRRGQAAFRAKLLAAYQRRCAISGCDVTAVLEAAHIKPYLGDHTDVVSNGLLLRADLHTLFDLGLLKIEPASRRVSLHSDLRGTQYEELEGRTLFEPADPAARPALDCLVYAWSSSGDVMNDTAIKVMA